VYYIQLLCNEVPTGIHNSLNPRPELLVGGDDDLPVHVSQYLLDLGPEGGHGVMKVFTDLCLKLTPHEFI
jgi:hypothetical protein